MMLTVLMLMACVMQESPKADKAEIVYEVFLQSFRDSNADGIGALQGLISKLDYIKELGATSVWITPVHPSPSYHKYDVIDYYGIHPDYGTMEDMDQLIAELHKRDMKLIMDLVVNHTSALHPWFIESSSSDTNPYHDYYVWKNYAAVQDEINKKTTTFDSDNITQWHPGEKKSEHYYGFFWKGMPDLNFDNPKVREEIYKIAAFWIEKGIDGFRLDAARHIYPDDQLDDTRLFWEEFTTKMKSIKPDIKIIGEVWSDPKTLSTLFKGLPSLFNFEMTKAIPEAINNSNPHNFITAYSAIASAYHESGVPYEDAILLCNHDMNRIRSTLHGDINKSKLAASILLTLPGTPYIYYGEEIGMLGIKPDEHIREPFLWGDDNFQKTTWLKPIYSIPSAVIPLAEQITDENSLYNHYKNLISLRKKHRDKTIDNMEFMQSGSDNLLMYKISGEKNEYTIIHNLSNQMTEVELPVNAKCISDNRFRIDNKYRMESYSSAVFLLK